MTLQLFLEIMFAKNLSIKRPILLDYLTPPNTFDKTHSIARENMKVKKDTHGTLNQHQPFRIKLQQRLNKFNLFYFQV